MINEQPLVSVMIPVYNGEKTLPLALSSLIHQTYTNWKAIIVNDGSTDGTKAYLDSLNDSRFKVIHFKKNKGRPYARQAALEAAEGKYLAFLDADDFYHPEKLDKQVEIMEDHPELDLISCTSASYDNEYNLLTVRKKHDFVVKKYYKSQSFKPSRAGSLVRLSAVSEFKYNFKLKHAEDTDFFSRSIDGKFHAALPDILYYYSEFVSVTGKKILGTYCFSILHINSYTNYNPFKFAKALFIIVFKFISVSFIVFLFGTNYLLKRRGVSPTIKETEDFSKTLSLIRR